MNLMQSVSDLRPFKTAVKAIMDVQKEKLNDCALELCTIGQNIARISQTCGANDAVSQQRKFT
jgi:hypothetical protein